MEKGKGKRSPCLEKIRYMPYRPSFYHVDPIPPLISLQWINSMQPATYVIIVYVPYSCVGGRQLHEWVPVCLAFKLRATLDKGPGTNWKQIEPQIGPFFTFKRIFFLKVQWVCLKAWGLIWGCNIKFVWLTYERIRLTFGFFSLLIFLMVFLIFCFHFHFVHLEGLKCSLSSMHLARIYKTNHVNSRIDQKNGRVGVLSTLSSIHRCVFHFHRIWATKIKDNNEKEQKTKKWTTLDCILHIGSPNHELFFKFFFCLNQLVFPPKWCHVS